MKKIKTFLFLMLVLSMATITFTSCDNDDCEDVTETLSQNQANVAERIQENLLLIMNDTTGEYKGGAYIVYSAEDDEFMLVSEFTYSLGDIFYKFMQGETCDTVLTVGSKPMKAPTGQGWRKGGTCSSELGAISLANKIAKQIPKGRNFEIHAECNSDGSYTVWYRII